MAKVNNVACPKCRGSFSIEKGLYQTATANPKQNLKCPFCKTEFPLQQSAGAK